MAQLRLVRAMERCFVYFAIVMLLSVAQLSVIAQSYPKAVAYYAPRPDYRPLPNGKRPEGSGVFTVQIDPRTGSVTSVLVKKSTGWATLDKAAIDAVRRRRFRTPSKPSVDVAIDFTH